MSGLAAGAATRLVTGDPLGRTSLPVATVTVAATTKTPTDVPNPAPTSILATATATPTVLPPAGFSLRAVVTPNILKPGAAFSVTTSVVGPDGVTPLAGIQCVMRAPTDGAAPLFQQWPTPQITDSAGKALWRLTAPSVAPGKYEIEVFAAGEKGWKSVWRLTVTIVAS